MKGYSTSQGGILLFAGSGILLYAFNSAALIPVCSTIVGIFISQFFTWLNKNSDWKNQVKLKKLENSIEFEKQHLITPIREFIETELIWLQSIYVKVIKKELKLNDKGNIDLDLIEGLEYIKNASVISAKVRVYGNKELSKNFDDFANKRMNVNIKTSDKLEEVEILASKILQVLKNHGEHIDKPWYRRLFS